MKQIIIIVISILSSLSLSAQVDQTLLKYVLQDTSVYGEMQNIWISQQDISYGSVLFNQVKSIGERRVPLREGEGKSGLFLAANMDLRFLLFQGRPKDWAFIRRLRTTFDYKANFRMMGDDSKPIVPYSNDVGIGMEVAMYDSHHGVLWKDRSANDQTALDLSNKGFFMITVGMQVHHYSNGQPPGFFYSEGEETRNDYLAGDFSTNYTRIRPVLSWVNEEHRLINLGLGIRKDWGLGVGGFVYSPEQNRSYGKWRLEYLVDWYSGPRYNAKNLREWHIRLQGDYITDNLDNFTPNLKNNQNKYRLSGHFFLEYRPLTSRSLGYMLHLYGGRDYLNIRYDDIVFISMVGVTFSIKKYYPTGWKVKNLREAK